MEGVDLDPRVRSVAPVGTIQPAPIRLKRGEKQRPSDPYQDSDFYDRLFDDPWDNE